MKTLALVLLALPAMASAQSFVTKKFGNKIYAMPMVNFIDIKSSELNGHSCRVTKYKLKPLMEEYIKSGCQEKKTAACLKIEEQVSAEDNFIVTAENPLRTYDITIHKLDEKKAIESIASSERTDPKNVKIFLPDYSKIRVELSSNIYDEEGFFAQVIKTFGIEPQLGLSYYADQVFAKGAITSCAIEDKSIGIFGEYDQTEVIRVTPEAATVEKAHKFYAEVAKAWKLENQKEWSSNMHKILAIGIILKEKSKGLDMAEYFPKFFDVNEENLAPKLKEFKNLEDFRKNAMPAYEEEFKVRGFLKQRDEE